jgi:integrase
MIPVRAFCGSRKLSELTAWHLEQYKKARKDAGKAPATVNLELTFLKTLLRKAQIWGKLGENPAKEVKLLKGVQGNTRFLSEEEEAALLAVCSPALQRIVQAGLRPEDVDLERGTVSVAACYSKNGESRTLSTGPRLNALLQESLVTCGVTTTLLTTENGEPWTPGRFANAFRRACRTAGVGALSPHVLRHTFASRHGWHRSAHRARTARP